VHHHPAQVKNVNKTTDSKINAMIVVTLVKDKVREEDRGKVKAAITTTATIKIVDKMEIRSLVVERMIGHKEVDGEEIGEIMEDKVRILYDFSFVLIML